MKIDNVFLERMKCLLGEEFEEFYQSLFLPQQKAIFVNKSKISVKEFEKIIDFDIEKIPYEQSGFYINNDKKGRHPLHHAGAFYLQEPSAMFTVNSVQFKGDETVLDMCAAPGGKSIQIASRIPNGFLISNEIVKSRSDILLSNIERMGLKNVIITNDTPENLANAYGNTFDVCLVDAPCSGEGMFRRGVEVTEQWNENLAEMCAVRQLDILSHAHKTIKTGGLLIYSTCTYAVKENEDVVREFIKKHNYELVNISYNLPRGIDMPEAVRLYPHKVRGEGQFVAVLRKLDDEEYSSNSCRKMVNSKITNDFMKNNTNLNEEYVQFEKFSYYVPNKNLIKKNVRYVSVGVKLGEVVGNRFEPHHNLFSAFGNNFNIKLNLDFKDILVEKYLRGETINCNLKDGYGAFVVNGCALGGFKISKGKFKNHYPKGLRNF